MATDLSNLPGGIMSHKKNLWKNLLLFFGVLRLTLI